MDIYTIILMLHFFIAAILLLLITIQTSDSENTSILEGSSTGNLKTETSDPIQKITVYFGIAFFASSFGMAYYEAHKEDSLNSVIESSAFQLMNQKPIFLDEKESIKTENSNNTEIKQK